MMAVIAILALSPRNIMEKMEFRKLIPKLGTIDQLEKIIDQNNIHR